MPPYVFLLLRFIHIVIGVAWAGSVIFIAMFLLPAIKATGPNGGAVMSYLTQVKRMPSYLMGGVILTILSGLALFWNASAGFSTQWMSSGPGKTFAFGGAMGIIVAILGGAVNAPTAKRMGELGAEIAAGGGPPSAAQVAEMQRLQQRMTTAMRAASVLLLLALTAMAVARYVPS
ncbi:MAG: hypothetical protein JWL61_5469 [Gemmatimonadetes bacterium]|jgi:hypothetical protein|nr:hypothetical protein [Gemmatimonadota bacterium]